MASFLDIALPIVEKDSNGDFVATTYFEDYLFDIINSIGGEGAESIVDESSSLLISLIQNKVAKLEKDILNIEHPDQSQVRAKIGKLEKDFLEIEHPDQSMVRADISKIKKELANLDSSSNVSPIRAKVNAHDKTLFNLEQLTSLLLSENASLRSILGGIKPFKIVELSAGDTAYTTHGNTILICNNTGLATITLNPTARAKEQVIVVRNGAGGVKVTATKKISGKTIKTILRRYTSPHHIFTPEADSWSVI